MSDVRKIKYGDPCVEDFNLRTAMEEASRCLLCEDAPCSQGCPAGTNPGKFIRSIRFRNPKGAAETIRENNILGSVCAMICPYDTLCEKACSRTGIDKPIEIGRLQKFAMDQERAFSMETLKAPEKENGKKVVCIGSGPASLACAAKLRMNGCQVKIIEQFEKAGGVLTYGITPTRLSQDIVDYDIKKVENLGVEFEFNHKVTYEEIEELKKEYDAVFLGIGLWKGNIANLEGKDLDGVYTAIDFLKKMRESNGRYEIGDNVIVIGGGDVAVDCATTCKQLNKNVQMISRTDIEKATASRRELDYLYSLGVPVFTGFNSIKINGKDGKITSVDFEGMDGESSMTLKADTVVFAIGQRLDESFKEVERKDNVFLGGDCANGGSIVVEAVADGKKVALDILDYLKIEEA